MFDLWVRAEMSEGIDPEPLQNVITKFYEAAGHV